MTTITQETYKKKYMRQGSFLKYCRNVGGFGLGLQVIGGMLLAVVWIIGLLTRSFMVPESNTMFLAAGSAVTLLILAGGILLQKKRVNGYINYYAKKNNYTPDEVNMLDSELSGNQVVLLGSGNGDRDIRSYYTITPHWVTYPLLTGYIRRIVDIAAVWFDPSPVYKGVQAADHLFMLDSKGEIMVFPMKEQYATDIIEELTSRNKNLIPARHFQFQDKQFDCQNQPEEVAKLYRQQVNMS